jgi:hypothetical protein
MDTNAARRARYAVRATQDEAFLEGNRARYQRYYQRHRERVIARVLARNAVKRSAEDAHWRAVQAGGGDVPKHVLRRWERARIKEAGDALETP